MTPLYRELSDGSLQAVGPPIYREASDGSLVEIGAAYRELSDGSLVQVYSNGFTGTLRPDSDVDNPGSWTSTEGDLHSAVDESSPDDDTSYVSKTHTGDTESSYTFEVGLSNPGEDPSGSETVTVRVRSKRTDDFSSGSSASIQGKVMEGTTQIDTFQFTEGSTWQTNETTVDLSSVSNYDDLRLEVTATLQGGSGFDTVTVRITWMEVEFVA